MTTKVKATKPLNPPRPGSKRAAFTTKLLAGGVTYAYAQKEWGWTKLDVNQVCSQLKAKYGIEIKRTDEGVSGHGKV